MHSDGPTSSTRMRPENRLGLDYAAEARRLGAPPAPIIDVHVHLEGEQAVPIYRRAAETYGVEMSFSMTRLENVERVAEGMEGRVRFIAVPDYRAADRKYHLGYGFAERLPAFHALGARVAKFWAAPRARDLAEGIGDPEFLRLDAPHRLEAMRIAQALGMIFMTHVGDPDTWFATKYADSAKYGTKREQYEPLERLLDEFPVPWIAAHFGGWPEDLEFVSDLLERHANLHLDTSATKWMVRELSRHSRTDLVRFLERFHGRVLFGSDIVTSDEHTAPATAGSAAPAHGDAFELYAGRYYALRTLFETDHEGPSPIADPDLALVAPDRYGALDAPLLRGKALPEALLRSLYHDAAAALLLA